MTTPRMSGHAGATRTQTRFAYADSLKVLLVTGVIVGHVLMAWSGMHAWALEEPPVSEPMLTVIKLVALVGTMFAMALFFMVAGAFTPGSLTRKGPRRFLADRAVRLGVPVVFYSVVLAPVVEYADSDNQGWTRGFPAFAWHIWRDPAPGPTWFLAVLFLMSAVYALVRALLPRRGTKRTPLRFVNLVTAMAFIVVVSYPIRIGVPFGEEYHHLALGQVASWVAGFTLGVVGAERGWFQQLPPRWAHRLFVVAWSAAGLVVVLVAIMAATHDGKADVLFGNGSWQSLLLLFVEAPLVVTMSLWMFDAFRRHVTTQGSWMQLLSRAAFATFIVHQLVAVGAVLATRYVSWPAEVECLTAAVLAVVGSFAVGAALIRIPAIARIV